MPYNTRISIVISEVREERYDVFYRLARRIKELLRHYRPAWDLLRTSWPLPYFFWGEPTILSHRFPRLIRIASETPGVRWAEYGTGLFHIGHGGPDHFEVDGEGRSVPIAVMEPGHRGARYFWLMSCNVLAHGAPSSVSGKPSFLDPEAFDVDDERHEDAFDRWGRNYGDTKRTRSPLNGGIRMVCSGSTTLAIYTHSLDATFEAMFRFGWPVADSFVHALTGPSQTPLVIAQGCPAKTTEDWRTHPLWDRELHTDGLDPAGTHLFIQYPRRLRTLDSIEKFWPGEKGTTSAAEPLLESDPCRLPRLDVVLGCTPSRFLDLEAEVGLRDLSSVGELSVDEEAAAIALHVRPIPENEDAWEKKIEGFARRALDLIAALHQNVEIDGWNVTHYEMAVAWREKPERRYGSFPGTITARKKADLATVSPRFLIEVDGEKLVVPFRHPLGYFSLRWTTGLEGPEPAPEAPSIAHFPFEADLAIQPFRVSEGPWEKTKGREAAMEKARAILDGQRLDPEHYYSRETDDVALEYRLIRPLRAGATTTQYMAPVYVVRFPPAQGDGPSRVIEVDCFAAGISS